MNFFTAKRTIRRLERALVQAESDLAVERRMNESLRYSLQCAVNRYAAQDYAIEDVQDAAAVIVQAPDGEFIAPAAFDWDRLAHDIVRDYYNQFGDDQGGASGSW